MNRAEEAGVYNVFRALSKIVCVLYVAAFFKNKNDFEKMLMKQWNRNEIDEALEIGAQKARVVAQNVLERVRVKAGYNA